MFAMFKSCARSFGAAGSSLALAGLVALPTLAFAADESTAPVDASNQQVVVRDAATGQLRAATPEEAQTLRAKTDGIRRPVARTMPKVHSSGAQGARLTDEFMSYSVLVKQPDGSLREFCFDSREAAEAALKTAPVGKTNVAPTE